MLLADYADHTGTPSDGGVVFELDRTQEELAAEIGTARESVSRALKQLRDRGMIRSRRGRRFVVADPETLRAWARGAPG
jgi:CRP-like cAMP-binding protein